MVDWSILKSSVIVFVISLLASLGVLVLAESYSGGQLSIFSNLERDFTKAKRRYNEARRDRSLYQQYLTAYLNFQNQGFIGEEQRLSWIEELEAINKNVKLVNLRYEISPQAPAEIPGLRVPAAVKVNVSRMKLNAGALHEVDVLQLLWGLQKKAKGYFSTQECELDSKVNKLDEFRYRPGLSLVMMECSLDWYSIEVQS